MLKYIYLLSKPQPKRSIIEEQLKFPFLKRLKLNFFEPQSNLTFLLYKRNTKPQNLS